MKPAMPGKILPQPNADTRPFWDFCSRHELRFQKCAACGHLRWPASFICPMCYDKSSEWVQSEGKGTVYSYVVYRQAFHPAFAEDIPYVTAVIALEEGPHFLSGIVGCAPEAVHCGMPVELTWEDVGEGFSLPKFKPVRRS